MSRHALRFTRGNHSIQLSKKGIQRALSLRKGSGERPKRGHRGCPKNLPRKRDGEWELGGGGRETQDELFECGGKVTPEILSDKSSSGGITTRTLNGRSPFGFPHLRRKGWLFEGAEWEI